MNANEDRLWIVELGASPERAIPTLLTAGNGRIGVRGAFPELGEGGGGIFLAGFYDQLPRPDLFPERFTPFLVSWSHMGKVAGYKREPCIVKCPDFLAGSWRIGGKALDTASCKVQHKARALDLRTGEVRVELRLVTPESIELRIVKRRFASMADETAVYERTELELFNTEAEVEYRAYIDDTTANFNISGIYQDTSDGTDHEYIRLYDTTRTQTQQGALAMDIRGRVDGQRAAFATRLNLPCAVSGEALCIRRRLKPGEVFSFERECSFECSTFHASPLSAVRSRLDSPQMGYEAAKRESDTVWAALWDTSDVSIDGDDRAQLGIRHSLYMLLISACRSSSNVSVPAKGLSGEGYRGMVFWDTDIHMLPFFLYTQPDTARRILSFRHRTLGGAREKAAKYGQAGASYPWETGVSGREECEDFLKLLTHQLHITSDVAYAMGRYVQATGDGGFLKRCAAECYLETARFWASKGYEEGGSFHIADASGPDELHLECRDSAYINNMALHNLTLALSALGRLKAEDPAWYDELVERTGVTKDELKRMERAQSALVSMKGPGGLYEQCEGFFALEDRIVWEDSVYDVPADTQTVKQADVLMLLFLLPELADREELRRNWDYYEPRTTHTSSLSYGVHGILAARLGLAEKAAYYLEKSLGIDLWDTRGGCEDGAHLAADGMSWSAVISGLCGVELNADVLSVSPALPEAWREVRFTLLYRGAKLRFKLDHQQLFIKNEGTEPAAVVLAGRTCTVKAGDSFCRSL
ncbi:MAG: hypothetical protein LLF87_08955 [Eubacteriales bacterium]|nr:hypothetical protein [Eubacteriales bacterium]